MKYCDNCGEIIKEQSEFCSTCGAKISNIKQNNGAKKSRTRKVSCNKKKITIISLIIVLMIVILYFAYEVLRFQVFYPEVEGYSWKRNSGDLVKTSSLGKTDDLSKMGYYALVFEDKEMDNKFLLAYTEIHIIESHLNKNNYLNPVFLLEPGFIISPKDFYINRKIYMDGYNWDYMYDHSLNSANIEKEAVSKFKQTHINDVPAEGIISIDMEVGCPENKIKENYITLKDVKTEIESEYLNQEKINILEQRISRDKHGSDTQSERHYYIYDNNAYVIIRDVSVIGQIIDTGVRYDSDIYKNYDIILNGMESCLENDDNDRWSVCWEFIDGEIDDTTNVLSQYEFDGEIKQSDVKCNVSVSATNMLGNRIEEIYSYDVVNVPFEFDNIAGQLYFPVFVEIPYRTFDGLLYSVYHCYLEEEMK